MGGERLTALGGPLCSLAKVSPVASTLTPSRLFRPPDAQSRQGLHGGRGRGEVHEAQLHLAAHGALLVEPQPEAALLHLEDEALLVRLVIARSYYGHRGLLGEGLHRGSTS